MLAIIFERAIQTVFIFPGKIKNLCNLEVHMDFRAVIEFLKDFLTFYDLQHRKKKKEQSGYIFLSYLFLFPFYL